MTVQCTAINGTNTTIYTSSGSTAITTLIVANLNTYIPATPTVGTSNLSVYIVPGGGTPNFNNMIINALPVVAGETFTFDNEKVILSNTDTVVAFASTINPSVSTTITAFSSKSGAGPYLVTFSIPSQGSNPTVGGYYSITGNSNPLYNGTYVATASSATSIQLSYTADPGTYGSGTTTINSCNLVATVSTLSV